MKNNVKDLSVPIRYEFQPFEDDRFKRVKVLVMHDGLNLNGSVFSMDAIEKAKNSITNIPILGYVKQVDGQDGQDFAGHESEIVLSENGINYRYLGRPIGIIPETCDYHYEIYDGKTFVAVTGYIWTDYANEALDILQSSGEKGQSMEIRVDDGEWDDYDNFNITSYRYTGVTVLGNDYTPAMTGAKVQMFTNSEGKLSFSQEYFEMVEQLNLALKEYSEVKDNMDDENVITDPIVTDEPVVTDPVEPEVTDPNGDGEPIVGNDPTPESDPTPAEPSADPVDYTVIIQQKDNDIFKLNTQLLSLKSQFDALQEKYNTLEVEAVELRDYRKTKEADETRDAKYSVFNEFSIGLTEDEMKDVKDKMDEYSVEQITSKLNSIFTSKTLSELKASNAKFTAENKDVFMDTIKKDKGKNKYAI